MSDDLDRKHPLCAKVFARVPSPGHALGIAVERDGTVYVGTHRQATGEPNLPSHVFAYDGNGHVVKDWEITGQAETGQGITGIALDADGVLYIVDQAPARVITLDPRTGEQTLYAELPDVPLCAEGTDGDCSQAGTDRPAQPINLAFGPDGHLYVGDLTQAAIWRIPPGGGQAEVWYTASDLDSLFGPNTVTFIDNGRTLLFADSAHGLQDPANLPTAKGRLIKLPVNRDGSPGEPEVFWEAEGDGDTPDGFAVGESGRVYVALAVSNSVAVISPDGEEIARVPRTPEENAEREVPFNLPGGVAFRGPEILVTNQVFLGGPEEQNVLFRINVHERGRELFRPRIDRP